MNFLEQSYVSKLCFGTLSISKFQSNLPLNVGIDLLSYARERGINFFDTAELYETYPYLKGLIKKYPDVIIATKTYAYSSEQTKNSLDKALREIGRDYIDIFLLHEQESELTIRGHIQALKELHKAKSQGKIKAVGISTHNIAAVKAAIKFPEIEIIHPLYNYYGWGIKDGTAEEMLESIKKAYKYKKKIYAMKVLAGGHLYKESIKALRHVSYIPEFFSIAVGMKSKQEIEVNLSIIKGETPNEKKIKEIIQLEKKLIVEEWCEGCGKCVERCSQKALSIDSDTNKVKVDHSKCILCGYCASVCSEFCLKVI